MGDSRLCSNSRFVFSARFFYPYNRHFRTGYVHLRHKANQSYRRKRQCFCNSRNCFRLGICAVRYFLCFCYHRGFGCVRQPVKQLFKPFFEFINLRRRRPRQNGVRFFSAKMRFYTDFTLVFFRFLHPLGILISAEKKENQIQKPKGNLL